MEKFDDKNVPPILDISELNKDTKQDYLCDQNPCTDLDIDCGECLFSTLWCKRELFEQWKKQKLQLNHE